MKLRFDKSESGDLRVQAIYHKTKKEAFDYTKMIKSLYEKNAIEEPIFGANVPKKDREIVKKMIEEINKVAIKKNTKKDK